MCAKEMPNAIYKVLVPTCHEPTYLKFQCRQFTSHVVAVVALSAEDRRGQSGGVVGLRCRVMPVQASAHEGHACASSRPAAV